MQIQIHQEDFQLDPLAALFWPKYQALFIADVHLGKTERALICLDEVINHFPDPAYLGRAKELKNTLNSKGKTS